jgi:hypothetical protein
VGSINSAASVWRADPFEDIRLARRVQKLDLLCKSACLRDSAGFLHPYGPDVSTFTFIGEFLLALWLVTRRRRITSSENGSHDGPIGPGQ